MSFLVMLIVNHYLAYATAQFAYFTPLLRRFFGTPLVPLLLRINTPAVGAIYDGFFIRCYPIIGWMVKSVGIEPSHFMFFVYYFGVEFSFAVFIFIIFYYYYRNRITAEFASHAYWGVLIVLLSQIIFIVKNVFGGFDILTLLKPSQVGILLSTKLYFFSSTPIQLKLTLLLLVFMFLFFSISYYTRDLQVRPLQPIYLITVLTTCIFSLLLLKTDNIFAMWCILECVSILCYFLTTYGNPQTTYYAFIYFAYNSLAGVLVLWGAVQLLAINSAGELSFDLQDLLAPQADDPKQRFISSFGWLLIVLGFLVKIGVAPFHFWAVDTYEVITTEIFFFFTTIVKPALVFTLFRIICVLAKSAAVLPVIRPVTVGIAVVSICVGIYAAYAEKKFQRFLALASLPQVGYVLVGLVSGEATCMATALAYFVFYILTTLVVYYTTIFYTKRCVYLTDFTGSSDTNPTMAYVFTGALLSFAGLPPFFGFFAKYWLLQALYTNGFIPAVIFILAASAISLYYYLNACIPIFMGLKKNTFIFSIQPAWSITKGWADVRATVATLTSVPQFIEWLRVNRGRLVRLLKYTALFAFFAVFVLVLGSAFFLPLSLFLLV